MFNQITNLNPKIYKKEELFDINNLMRPDPKIEYIYNPTKKAVQANLPKVQILENQKFNDMLNLYLNNKQSTNKTI